MQYEWDEAKRLQNLKGHGIDFADAHKVFAGPTFTYEDDRLSYGEQRFVTLGLLQGIPVSLAHTELGEIIRPISFRKATTHETAILLREIQDQLPQAPRDEGRRRGALSRAPRSKPKSHRSGHRKKRPKGRGS